MNVMTIQQTIECFHLIFLLSLTRKIKREYYALKGGCNLRFFFKSPRYSQDMDFDLKEVGIRIFQEQVNMILRSKVFKDTLYVKGIAIEHITEHKQIETTQRWKLGIKSNNSTATLPTKIEFSRRESGWENNSTGFESIDEVIISRYGLAPILINHYKAETSLQQKLKALCSRKVPQARDIFDIYLLLTSNVIDISLFKRLGRSELSKIKEKILSIDYSIFKSQVVSYLHPDDTLVYDSEDVWDTMRLKIIEDLER
jgi:predicted nucleotidyltransferase component of viral defense system